MGQIPQVNSAWLGSTYTLYGNSLGSRECINAYLQSGEGEAKYSEIIIGTPGTEALVELTDEGLEQNLPCRALWLAGAAPNKGSNLYWVFGNKLGYTYKNDFGDFVSTVLYDIGLDASPVSITDNGFNVVVATGTQMLVVDIFTGGNGKYVADRVYDITSDLPFSNPLEVVYLKGRVYAIASPTVGGVNSLDSAVKSNVIWYSELPGDAGGAKVWDGLSFVGADLSSDPVTSITVCQGDIWAHGPRSSQIFISTPDADAPLQYSSGSASEIGTNAPQTVSSIGSDIFWLGSNASGRNIVFVGKGYNAVRISTHAIESSLDVLNELTDYAYAFSYTESGHTFYVLSVPPGTYTFQGSSKYSHGITFCYDTLTRKWHRRSSRNPKTGALEAYQPKYSVFAWGKILTGNSLWSTIMELRNDVYTDYDPTTTDDKKPMTRIYQGPVLFKNMQEFILDEFKWDVLTGFAPLNGLSEDPVAQIFISQDGGNTFEFMGKESLAKVGEYARQVRFVGLGASRAMVIRIVITEDIPFQAGQAVLRTRVSRQP